MITLKLVEGEDGVYKNTDDVIYYMKETNFERDITVYDIDKNDAYKKTNEIYSAIKKYNEGKPLDIQILPSNPCEFRGIIGCLGVHAYTISLGMYKNNHESIALFSGFNDSVLDTSKEKSKIRPGLKAMASLSMLGQIYRQKGKL